jgi:hypothetical protein
MNPFPHDKGEALQQRVIALIKPLIPPDAQERVIRAYKEFSKIVRSHIRSETRLSLADDENRDSVPVKIVEGFPVGIAQLIDKYQDRTLWRLILALPKLGGIVDGLGLLVANWEEFERWLELPDSVKGSKPALEKSVEVAKTLQALAVTKKVFEQLKEINEDILGVYRFGDAQGPRVEIFWMAHALFAGAFALRIEDLTVVTLAHELSHAYTHVGRSIDGKAWVEPGFGSSDLRVVEGLAQFYTLAVAVKLNIRAPGVFQAFTKLLEFQSAPYKAHAEWLKDSPNQLGESVRFAMLRARSRGQVANDAWLTMLAETKAILSAQSPQKGSNDVRQPIS